MVEAGTKLSACFRSCSLLLCEGPPPIRLCLNKTVCPFVSPQPQEARARSRSGPHTRPTPASAAMARPPQPGTGLRAAPRTSPPFSRKGACALSATRCASTTSPRCTRASSGHARPPHPRRCDTSLCMNAYCAMALVCVSIVEVTHLSAQLSATAQKVVPCSRWTVDMSYHDGIGVAWSHVLYCITVSSCIRLNGLWSWSVVGLVRVFSFMLCRSLQMPIYFGGSALARLTVPHLALLAGLPHICIPVTDQDHWVLRAFCWAFLTHCKVICLQRSRKRQ